MPYDVCRQLCLSSYYYMCVLILVCMWARWQSSYYSICVRILLYYYMCSHTTVLLYMWQGSLAITLAELYVSSYYYTTIYVCSYYYICILILLYMWQGSLAIPLAELYVSSYYYSTVYVCSYYMCVRTTTYVSSYYHTCGRARWQSPLLNAALKCGPRISVNQWLWRYICVLILLHMCPHTTTCVRKTTHTTIYIYMLNAVLKLS